MNNISNKSTQNKKLGPKPVDMPDVETDELLKVIKELINSDKPKNNLPNKEPGRTTEAICDNPRGILFKGLILP